MTNIHELTPPPVRRTDALWQDPNLSGDLLLVALAIDHLIDTHGRRITSAEIKRVTGIGPAQYWCLIQQDIPHYEPPPGPRWCMYVGSRGGVCRRRPGVIRRVPDIETGEVAYRASCLPHKAWVEHVVGEIEAGWGGRVPPKPAYNTRSKLAPHFDEIDWPLWWRKWGASSLRREPYDITRDVARGGSPLAQRPRLRVVMGT